MPDPSWEWVWSDWHINHQEGVDEGGWEYSFAFSNLFSWHGPRWHNSFVRRRAWTRKRAKKRVEDLSTDPHMINGDYFTVRPSRSSVMAKKLSRTKSPGSSIRPPSTMTVSSHGADDGEGADVEMDSIDTLLRTLRTAALDREKLEATIRYLDGEACDLDQLQDHMHDIMGNFVFQASRRLLLGHIMKLYSSVKEEVDGGDRGKETETEKGKEAETRTEKPELRARLHALEVALEHAEEEVRKLAYWSDVKEMADKGIRPRDARDKKDGSAPGHEWEGLDHSGPSEPNGGKLPGKLPEKSP